MHIMVEFHGLHIYMYVCTCICLTRHCICIELLLPYKFL